MGMSVSLSVSLSVCLSVCPHEYLIACGRSSVLLWRRCNMLRTSGFVGDVMFFYNILYTHIAKFCCFSVTRYMAFLSVFSVQSWEVWMKSWEF